MKAKLRSYVFGSIQNHKINFKLTISIKSLQIQNLFSKRII